MVEKLFDPATKNPYAMLDEYTQFLESISFGDKKTVTTMGNSDMWGDHLDGGTSCEIPSIDDLAQGDDFIIEE